MNFWELSPHNGRKLIYPNTEEGAKQFYDDCMEYFEATDKRNDWDKTDWVGAAAKEVDRKQKIPYQISGLSIFLGMTSETFLQYGSKPLFSSIVKRVREIIRTQKYEGATTGHFNQLIISKDLGLGKEDEKSTKSHEIKVILPDGVKITK